MKIEFKKLPYAANALEPIYSAETVHLHYEKHHRGYFDKTVELIKGTKFENMSLEEIIQATAKDKKHVDLFRNASQTWNHDVFWDSMRPKGGGKPKAAFNELIVRDFGSFEKMTEQLQEAAVKQFGSGWAWLICADGKLSIEATSNADDPLPEGVWALLAIDVWEHAYYLDYQNRRAEYVHAFLEKLVNWDYAWKILNDALASEKIPEQRRSRRA